MTDWEIVRHTAAISGQVRNGATGKTIGGAAVVISDAPAEFTDWLKIKAEQFGKHWNSMSKRPDRTQTGADGHFHFIDLPDGAYTLVASLPAHGSRYGQGKEEVQVTRNGGGNIVMATVTIQLPPTSLKGTVTTQGEEGAEAVVMAEVRISGSGEKTFSDSNGNYMLTGLEKGLRTVLISARGYQSARRIVDIEEAGVTKILNVVLVAEP